MPVKLPSGLIVYNVTPHPLHFQTKEGVVTAPSDGVLNAVPVVQDHVFAENYTLSRVTHVAKPEQLAWLRGIRRVHPHALIVGSWIAARAYSEFVVTGVPVSKRDRIIKDDKPVLIRSDRFTYFPHEKGSEDGDQECE